MRVFISFGGWRKYGAKPLSDKAFTYWRDALKELNEKTPDGFTQLHWSQVSNGNRYTVNDDHFVEIQVFEIIDTVGKLNR